MLKAVLYILAAASASFGGPAAGTLLFRRGQQEAAAYLQARDTESIARALRDEIGLASLRDEARAAGIDPDVIERVYRDLRDGTLTIDQAAARLRGLDPS
ncbi:hypothetical protein [Blastococcus deserti]|uniref:Antitoxin VbhA domain-containing protein n=1 Tax=Blastococcus deserti TaxID=2259033 RepID=A0ABW4X6M4_9ACTN